MHHVVVWFKDVLVPFLGTPGVFLAAFLDSSFLSLPEITDLVVVTAAAQSAERGWLYAAASTVGSVAGCVVLWWIGWRGEEAFLERRFGVHRVARARAAFHKWDFLALAIPALLPPPMPFKLFVIAAGVFDFPLLRFVLTLLIARGLRYALWAFVGIQYGDRAMDVFNAVDAWFGARLPWVGAAVALALAAWLIQGRLRRRRAA
jgi:membrane protein YqaA with SNARE-associated domain